MDGSEVVALREAVDRLADVDPVSLTPPERGELLVQLEIVRTLLTSVFACVLRAFDRNGDWAPDGAYSAANWIAARTGTARADMVRRVRLSNRLEQMPLTGAALAAAEITEAHVQVLTRCLGRRTFDAFVRDEEMLVGYAKTLNADQLSTVVAAWIDAVDQDGAEPHPEKPSSLHASQLPNGRVVGKFDLEASLGVPFLEQLRAKTEEVFARAQRMKEVDPTDPLGSASQPTLRAHALADLVDRGGAVSDPERRRPALCVQLPADLGEDDAPLAIRRTLFGNIVPRALLDMWACDCDIERMVMNADNVPIQLGRAVRFATPAQRKVLAARDGGCAVPGCDTPPTWCDAHHVRTWSDGGKTDVDVMCLLCRNHHTRVHGDFILVRMENDRPRFELPDGRVLVEPERRTAAA